MTDSDDDAGALPDSGSRPSSRRHHRLAVAVAAAIAVALGFAAFSVYGQGEGAKLSLSIVFGSVFGFVLQRSRFCFFCIFRDWLDNRDPRGLFGLLLALAVGMTGYTIVFGAWLPDSTTGRLPPDAFIGPVSLMLVAAGLAFGTGMGFSGSCISAHLYRLGEGSPTAPFALIGTAAGLALGFWTWSATYTPIVAPAPVIWLPGIVGYTGALLLALAVLAILGLALLRWRNPSLPKPALHRNIWDAIFVARWPAWIGGLAIGALGSVSYLRVGPLGVTAEIAARSRQAATSLGTLPAHIVGLDTLRGCVVAVSDTLLSPNGVFVVSLVFASFAGALVSGQFEPKRPRLSHVTNGLFGGVLMGWGAMTGLGCTIGTLLSGIMAGALSGWIFGAAVFVSVAATLRRHQTLARAVTS